MKHLLLLFLAAPCAAQVPAEVEALMAPTSPTSRTPSTSCTAVTGGSSRRISEHRDKAFDDVYVYDVEGVSVDVLELALIRYYKPALNTDAQTAPQMTADQIHLLHELGLIDPGVFARPAKSGR